jgi:hypothetical protein
MIYPILLPKLVRKCMASVEMCHPIKDENTWIRMKNKSCKKIVGEKI